MNGIFNSVGVAIGDDDTPRGARIQPQFIPMRKKNDVRKLKDRLWELCKQIVRARYRLKDGTWHCYTCGRVIDEPAKAQTGHCIPSAVGGALLRYHLDNLRVQCYACNINYGGQGAIFVRHLTDELGEKRVDAMFALQGKSVKADSLWYQGVIAEYETLVNQTN